MCTSCASQPERVRVLFDLLAESLFRVAGIRLHDGRRRVWNALEQCPTTLKNLGLQCGSREESRSFVLLLGHQVHRGKSREEVGGGTSIVGGYTNRP